MPSQRTLSNVSRTLNTDGIPVPVRAVLTLGEAPAPNEWKWEVMQDSWGITEGMTLTVNDPSEIDGWEFNWAEDTKLSQELNNFEVTNSSGEPVYRFFIESYSSSETFDNGAIAFMYDVAGTDSPDFSLKVIQHDENGSSLYEPQQGDILILQLIPYNLQNLPTEYNS